MPEKLIGQIDDRAKQLFRSFLNANSVHTNGLFTQLFVFQWIVGVITALTLSPYTWNGAASSIHPHVVEAVVLGGFVALMPIVMMRAYPTRGFTRHIVAVSQMLTSALFIDLSGGRIETHFHIFGSLAFLSFYRDWRVLITASAVVALDHLLRGMFAPASVYGVEYASPFRTLEHASWVVFIDVFLIIVCMRRTYEMQERAVQQAKLEATNDIIERRVIEQTEELRTKEEQTQTILDTADDAIFAVFSDGVIQTANCAASRLFSIPSDKLRGMQFSSLVDLKLEDRPASFIEYTQHYSMQPGKITRDQEICRPNGTRVPVELSMGKVEYADTSLFTVIVRDVSERKDAERRVNEFYSTISHELRSPLTSIRGALSLIEGGMFGDIPGDALELINIANASTKRLIRLINDILDLRKIEAGKMELDIAACQVTELAQTSVAGLQSMANDMQVRLQMGTVENLEIRADADRVIQILTNLISNAIKFSKPGDSVQVSAERMGEYVRFAVADTGIGIAEADFAKLFNKFQQLDSSDSRNSEGTGLGLAICKAIIEQHNGKIGFQSKVGEGSTFWFDLPVSGVDGSPKPAPIRQYSNQQITQDPKPEMQLLDLDCSQETADPNAKRKVLVVDDDAGTRNILSKQLSMLGLDCVEAADGAEAISLVRKHTPDLIVLDVQMPRPNGFEVVDILRQQHRNDTRLIVYSAHDFSDEQRRALTLGATRHINKAARSEKEFLCAVNELLCQELESSQEKPALSGIAK